jgi:two-component system, chemotaxis family, protein-glutamate methylesterase/glutaminase
MDFPYKVMIVDDSSSIRNILRTMLQDAPFIRVVGEAENGKIAIDLARLLQPEVILLDIEMPGIDGISALPQIVEASPFSQIIMVSTLTEKNAAISIKALSLGAADYLRKPEADIDKNIFRVELLKKIETLGSVCRSKKSDKFSPSQQKLYPDAGFSNAAPQSKSVNIKPMPAGFRPSAIAIASSTGGPQALQAVLDGLKGHMPNIPIFITQHMPPVFTKYLADSLASSHSIKCIEAQDNMEVTPGTVYIAPGDYHMLVKKNGFTAQIQLSKSPHENFCRPSAEPMLRSIKEAYGNKVLVVILTGMGQDGLSGATDFANSGGVVIAQDNASSVVWGMPGAVCEAGITSGVYPLPKIADRILQICEQR